MILTTMFFHQEGLNVNDQRDALLVPEAIVVTGLRVKSVSAGVEIGKGCRTLLTGIDPIFIKPIEAMGVLIFIAGRKIQRNKIYAEEIEFFWQWDFFCFTDWAPQQRITFPYVYRVIKNFKVCEVDGGMCGFNLISDGSNTFTPFPPKKKRPLWLFRYALGLNSLPSNPSLTVNYLWRSSFSDWIAKSLVWCSATDSHCCLQVFRKWCYWVSRRSPYRMRFSLIGQFMETVVGTHPDISKLVLSYAVDKKIIRNRIIG